MSAPKLTVDVERWPILGRFAISRGARTEAVVVVATITDGSHRGRGECVPYARYGETVEGVRDAVTSQADAVASGLDREALQTRLPAGAARNALDCALWDLAAKQGATSVAALAGIERLARLETAYTIGLDAPAEMARKAVQANDHRLLKIKLGGDGDLARLEAVRRARPEVRLIVDANEGWRPEALGDWLAACAEARVDLVEQPLPANQDGILAETHRPVLVCADESIHDRRDLAVVATRYDAVNVKLDKAGGLTEAMALVAEARARELAVMVGCMVGTSLAMAPAIVAAQGADFVDLDGPLLLARDRDPGLTYEGGFVAPPEPGLWG